MTLSFQFIRLMGNAHQDPTLRSYKSSRKSKWFFFEIGVHIFDVFQFAPIDRNFRAESEFTLANPSGSIFKYSAALRSKQSRKFSASVSISSSETFPITRGTHSSISSGNIHSPVQIKKSTLHESKKSLECHSTF